MDSLQINYQKTPSVNGYTLATVHWYSGNKPMVKNKFSKSDKTLETFVDNTKRDIIIDLVLKFVRQRNHALDNNHTQRTGQKVAAISKIKKGMDAYSTSPIKQVARIILCLEFDLRCLIPGPKSKYHIHFHNRVNQIINYCKNIENGQQN